MARGFKYGKKLDPKKLAIIKETLPIVKQHGETITKHFYKRMFKQHPELLNIFNQTHQITGHQPKALADAVYGAAANIEDFSQIMPVLERIGEKHRSLQIKPEHYPIVGENLLGAIKEVLGDAATDDIIGAWADAYAVISDVFIRMEEKMYKISETMPGGWAGFREFVVDKKVKESDVITSFYFKPKDGEAIAEFIPGQYLTLRIDSPRLDYTCLRQYSLSDRPGHDYYRISVKREDPKGGDIPAGVVSTYLHNVVKEGDIIPITAPAGDFYLDTTSTRPLVLISGGVGQTPMMCMLNSTVDAQASRETYFVHAAINSKFHAFKDHVEKLVSDHPQVKSFVIYEKPTEDDKQKKAYDKEGYIDLEWIQHHLPKDADFYFCGPEPFMRAVNRSLKEWGVPEDRIHYEFFGSFGKLDADL
ncbi:NO-inducible flavohemoprotein [Pullulanibacillus sp. KACC 23026]|uniref:NO-inducible flavohemoprotein n=1 Tax=Pullulanibacillus sp. KACC 23026 TaxID=3028315 RepID=UPI0023AE910F|nr:NO-inducible flavohemoprotein [Pullulanibacillus sp. KACC 23026]WEG13802.1 NO-inducible flavohemoprotein [Pullulanibacillus sp. KACC 23026]